MLETLRNKFMRRQTERSRARCTTLNQFAMLTAEEELGIATDVVFDHDELLELLDDEKLTIADFEVNVEMAKNRIRWAKLSAQEETLKVESERLDAEWRSFDIAEATRHREALKELADMKMAADRASTDYIDAFTACQELLATAAPLDDGPELREQLAEVRRQILAIETKLNPRDLPNDSGQYVSSVEDRPARLARQARTMLAEKNTGYTPERRKQIESWLAAAEREISRCDKELARLQKQCAAINAKQTVGPDDWKRPENFAIVRKRQSRDDMAKQQAQRMGWHGGPAATLTVG